MLHYPPPAPASSRLDTMLDAHRLAGLMAEPDRRRVAAALILAAGDVDDISDRAGLAIRETKRALDRLESGGLVVASEDGHYVILEEAFKVAARATATLPINSEFPDETTERRLVLDRSFRKGRVVHLPTKRSKRLIVLDHLAQRFEPGIHYTERQINASLAAVYEDTAALRRYLVDEGLLERADGEYWRSGGTV